MTELKKTCLDKDEYVTALKTTSLTHNFVRDVEHALGEHMSFFEVEQHRVQPDAYNEALMSIVQKVALEHFGKTHKYTQAHTEISTLCATQIQQSQKLKEIACTQGGPPGLAEPTISISVQIERIKV